MQRGTISFMIAMRDIVHTKAFHRLTGLFFAFAWVLFAYFNLRYFFQTGNYAFLFSCISEALCAVFFVFRDDPKTFSTDPLAWAAAFGGTFASLNLRPGGAVLWDGGAYLVTIGVFLQIIAFFSLNTSFSIVPANRGIKITLGYRIVRHPIYATYLMTTVGYVLFNATPLNFFWEAFFLVLTFFRIREEEKHLLGDAAYRSYVQKVKYRLIPYIY